VLRSRAATVAVAVAVGALVVAGLAVGGALGGILVLVVAAALVVLSSATWERLPAQGRGTRIAVVLVVAAIGVAKLVGA
jgi:hypothetical protein